MTTTADVLAGEHTLVASWDALARISPGARVLRTHRYVAAVFPGWAPLNNAVLQGEHDERSATAVAREVTALYRDAGVAAAALWVPSRTRDLDRPRGTLSLDRLARDTTTLVMTARLSNDEARDPAALRTSIAAATRASDEPVAVRDLEPPDDVEGLDGWAIVEHGVAIGGAWSCILGDDCGVYSVGTAPAWRRRGFARRLVAHVMADARERGARTASLQSTPMGRPLYEVLGFEPVGRYEEWALRLGGT